MANFCPASCTTDELLTYPPAPCEPLLRENSLGRIGFSLCSVSIPDDIDEAAYKALVDSGAIVFSSEIANFAPSDPVTENVIISSCRPAKRVVRSRELVFEDRIAVQILAGSPAVVTNGFYDYDWWANKVNTTIQLNVQLVYCNGDVVKALNPNGGWLSVDVYVYLNWQNTNPETGAPAIEFKRVSMLFNGDPFALTNKPFINLNDAGVTF